MTAFDDAADQIIAAPRPKTLLVSGYSDDLVELEGAIRAEFDIGTKDGLRYVAVSDGTIMSIHYDTDGVWRIAPVDGPISSYLNIEQAPANDEDNYSDRAVLTTIEPIRWAVLVTNRDHVTHVLRPSKETP